MNPTPCKLAGLVTRAEARRKRRKTYTDHPPCPSHPTAPRLVVNNRCQACHKLATAVSARKKSRSLFWTKGVPLSLQVGQPLPEDLPPWA